MTKNNSKRQIIRSVTVISTGCELGQLALRVRAARIINPEIQQTLKNLPSEFSKKANENAKI